MRYKHLFLFLLLFVTGCGYHMGSIMHPQVKSIAIAPVINESLAYNAASDMRGMLSEQVMRDGSLKLTDLKTADCILHARILEVTYNKIDDDSYNSQIFRPSEWRISVKVEFEVIIPGKREPLVSRRVVSGTANIQALADLEGSRMQGTRYACFDAAERIIQATTEAW